MRKECPVALVCWRVFRLVQAKASAPCMPWSGASDTMSDFVWFGARYHGNLGEEWV